MKDIEKISIAFIGLVICCGYFYIKGCNKPAKVKVRLVDTSTYEKRSVNAKFDQLNQTYINNIDKLEKENARLKLSAKTKVIYRERILHDTIKTIEYSNESLELCNEYSIFQDSIITNLTETNNFFKLQNKNLLDNLDFNKKYDNTKCLDELAKYRHLFFRIYRK